MSAALSSRVLARVSLRSPELRRKLWKQFYRILARNYRNPEWTFMNYGYAGPETREDAHYRALLDSDPAEYYSLHLYEKTIHGVALDGLDVLEVGCGRGGGSAHLSQHKNPQSLLGLDFSESSISLCQQQHSASNASFRVGDAEQLPCQDNSFDVVVNVESSHCYGDPEQFFREAHRVVRPGGYLLWTDFRHHTLRESTLQQMQTAGLELLEVEDITASVVNSLDLSSPGKEQRINKSVPFFMRSAIRDFAGIKGARVCEALRSGESIYLRAMLRKAE